MFPAFRACVRPLLWTAQSHGSFLLQSSPLFQIRPFHPTAATSVTMNQAMRRKKPQKIEKSRSPLLDNSPQKKGVCTQIFIAKPKKPNSAKRKVARVKLSNGKTLQAYIQGEGHNLQEHSVVLVRGGRAQDLPGVGYVGARRTSPFINRRTQVQSCTRRSRLWWSCQPNDGAQ